MPSNLAEAMIRLLDDSSNEGLNLLNQTLRKGKHVLGRMWTEQLSPADEEDLRTVNKVLPGLDSHFRAACLLLLSRCNGQTTVRLGRCWPYQALDGKLLWVQGLVLEKEISVGQVPTEWNYSDIGTKPLNRTRMLMLLNQIGAIDPTSMRMVGQEEFEAVSEKMFSQQNQENLESRRPRGSVGRASFLTALTDCRWWFDSLLVRE